MAKKKKDDAAEGEEGAKKKKPIVPIVVLLLAGVGAKMTILKDDPAPTQAMLDAAKKTAELELYNKCAELNNRPQITAPDPTAVEPTTTTAVAVETTPATEGQVEGTGPATTRSTVPRVVTTTPRETSPSPGVPTTSAPPVTTPATTAAPPTTEPPPPPSTAPVTCSSQQGVQAVGRNAMFYRLCSDGLHYVQSVTAPGWQAGSVLRGPPTVSVTFSNGSQSLTCSVSVDSDGIVNVVGDC
jgi:hypothetical protein